MAYQIIVEFPNEEIADTFCGQMSDGIGEGFCSFNCCRQKEGTTGKNHDDYEVVYDENGRKICFVNSVFD